MKQLALNRSMLCNMTLLHTCFIQWVASSFLRNKILHFTNINNEEDVEHFDYMIWFYTAQLDKCQSIHLHTAKKVV